MAGKESICQQNLSLYGKKGHSSKTELSLKYNDYENISMENNLISEGVSSTLVHPEKVHRYKS
jgi:hypothetical protein